MSDIPMCEYPKCPVGRLPMAHQADGMHPFCRRKHEAEQNEALTCPGWC